MILIIKPNSLRCTALGTVSGVVYARHEHQYFPEENWTDLVVGIVHAWLQISLNLLVGHSKRERLRFLDGPFAIELSLGTGKIIEVAFIECRLKDDVNRAMGGATLTEIVQNACELADCLLAECASRNWSNPAIEALASERKQSRALVQEAAQLPPR